MAGESAGSKLEKAERLGIRVISESKLDEILGGAILEELQPEKQSTLREF